LEYRISSYALTVEPKTALNKLIQTGKIAAPKDEVAEHFAILVETLEANDLYTMNCQILAKNYFSKNNSAYWLGKIPWNWSFTVMMVFQEVGMFRILYLKSIQENKLPNEIEILSITDRYNEYIMTGLRTIWGVSLDRIGRIWNGIFKLFEQTSS
jgi:oxygen-independent coproporphyrinogen-3 oxidase